MQEASKQPLNLPQTELIPAAVSAVIQDQLLRQREYALPNGQPGQSAAKNTLLDYWHLVRRRKALILFTALVGGILSALITIPQTPVYQSRAAIEIQDINENFLFDTKALRPVSEGGSSIGDVGTQIRVIQSRLLTREVASKLASRVNESAAPPVPWWQKPLNLRVSRKPKAQAISMAASTLRVRGAPGTRIVEIIADSTDPTLAAEFLNTLASRYIEQNMEARWQMTQRASQWLTGQLDDMRIKLERSEEALQNYARRAGMIFTSGEKGERADVAEDRLRQIQEAYSAAQAARIAKQSRSELATTSPPETLSDTVDDKTLQVYQEKITDLKRQLAEGATIYSAEHPKMKRLQVQINSLDEALRHQREAILARIDNDYKQAVRHENLLRIDFLSQAAQVTDQSGRSVQYKILQREVESNRAIYDSMLQRMKEASVASAMRASNVRVVEPAEPASAPYKPDLGRAVYLGVIVGLFAGLGFVILSERVDRTLQDPGNIETELDITELGVVPSALDSDANSHSYSSRIRRDTKSFRADQDSVIETRPIAELATWQRPSSLVAEAFRALLTSLLFSNGNGVRPRVLVLSSAAPAEGKTMVLSNLGIALAEIKQRTLLIDADMRKPRIHRVFGLDNSVGLSTLLSSPGVGGLDDLFIQGTHIPNLYVLPSGPTTLAAANLLHGPVAEELLKRVKREFDMVLIDTPPMLQMPDARIMGRIADALILVARSQQTTRDAAKGAVRRLAEDGVRILGGVLNDWNPKRAAPGSYYYYKGGYVKYYQTYHGAEDGTGLPDQHGVGHNGQQVSR